MGVSKMVENGAQRTLVWVQRRNGTWWPGRVVEPHEIPPFAAAHQLSSSSSLAASPSTSKTPIMLLGKDYHSVDWYNLEKSKRIKAFRCGEFDDCIKQAESFKASTCAENTKYARRQDAILHALALEKKEQQKKLKRAGEVQTLAVCRAKRSRCTYLPIQSQSSKVSTSRVESDDSTFVSGIVAENSASMETQSHSSENNHRDSDRGRVVQASGHSQRQLRSMKMKKQDELSNSSKSPNNQIDGVGIQEQMLKVKFKNSILRGRPSTDGKISVTKNSTREVTDPLALDATSQEIGYTSETKSGENIDREVSESDLGVSSLDGSDTNCFGSAYTVRQNGMEMMLIDVDLTVQQNYRGEHVPFICLVSRASEKAIIGHPIEIEVLHDSSESFLPRKNSISKRLFEDDRSRIHQLVWKTSRRTPVCYISNSHSCHTPEDGKSASASQSFSDSRAKGNGFSLAVESSSKSLKKYTFSNDKALAHAIIHKGSGNDSHRVTCVPVKHIFSKLFEAVGKL